jgi:hypothetical protein
MNAPILKRSEPAASLTRAAISVAIAKLKGTFPIDHARRTYWAARCRPRRGASAPMTLRLRHGDHQ